MGFWTAITIIVIVAIGTEFVLRIIKMSLRHSENVERIKHGYPTLDGTRPLSEEFADKKTDMDEHTGRLQ